MAILCSIYDVDLTNLADEHGLVVGEDLSGKVDIVLTDAPDNIRGDRNDAHVEYDVFDSSGMEDMAKVLREVMKPGAHWHVFCSAIQFALLYKALSLEKMEERDSNIGYYGERGSEGDESKSVELRQVVEKLNSALRYISSAANYQ